MTAVTRIRRGRGPVDSRPAPVARVRKDRGSVTAEFAVAMPAVVLLLFVGVTAVSGVVTKLQCVDAARQAARAAARGDDGHRAGERVAPHGATVAVSSGGGDVRAVVRAPVRPFGAVLPAMSVSATAVAAAEPGTPG